MSRKTRLVKQELRKKVECVRDKAHNAVAYVGKANYVEREREAHRCVDKVVEALLEYVHLHSVPKG